MTNQCVLVAFACVMLSVATSARAQDGPEQLRSQAAAEITPYVFLASGTTSGVGTAIRWPLASPLSVELETNYRHAEINALSFNLSLLFDLPRMGPATPYVVGGVGVDQYGTPEALVGNIATRKRTAVSVNAGGGIRVQTDENWGVRADARWFNDLGAGPERWRLYNGVTFGRARR